MITRVRILRSLGTSLPLNSSGECLAKGFRKPSQAFTRLPSD